MILRSKLASHPVFGRRRRAGKIHRNRPVVKRFEQRTVLSEDVTITAIAPTKFENAPFDLMPTP
jgi:hypothetical protein